MTGPLTLVTWRDAYAGLRRDELDDDDFLNKTVGWSETVIIKGREWLEIVSEITGSDEDRFVTRVPLENIVTQERLGPYERASGEAGS